MAEKLIASENNMELDDFIPLKTIVAVNMKIAVLAGGEIHGDDSISFPFSCRIVPASLYLRYHEKIQDTMRVLENYVKENVEYSEQFRIEFLYKKHANIGFSYDCLLQMPLPNSNRIFITHGYAKNTTRALWWAVSKMMDLFIDEGLFNEKLKGVLEKSSS